MAGEEQHGKGADGVRRAKQWLEFTTRATVPWTTPAEVALNKLTFSWHNGDDFSYDLAGHLIGGDVDGRAFVAEVKNYAKQGDQPDHYRDFLAKCYRAFETAPARCDHFLWITWAPFRASVWDELRSPDRVRKAVARKSELVLGDADVDWEEVPTETAAEVAQRIWIIVLSGPEEEHLRLTREHYGVVKGYIASESVGGA